jgi:hypothetical protein
MCIDLLCAIKCLELLRRRSTQAFHHFLVSGIQLRGKNLQNLDAIRERRQFGRDLRVIVDDPLCIVSD